MESSSKRFSIYRQFKDCFEREHCVDVIWINIYRNAFAQFRTGVSQINTHTYRYSKLPEEVNCPFCENTPEGEIHSLLHCPIYWAIQAGLLTPLTFARHRLSPLATFTSGTYFLHNGRR